MGSLTRATALAAGVALLVIGAVWMVRDDSTMSVKSAAEAPTATSAAPSRPSTGVATSPGSSAAVARAAPSQIDAQRPRRLTLPSGTAVDVRVASTSGTGELVLPSDINQAGWWDGGAKLGDPYGAVVIAAHVDSFEQGLGNFSELLSTRPGDTVSVASRTHQQLFNVVSAGLVSKSTLSGESPLYSARGEARLVLVTCGGPYDPDTGYRDNMVVVAVAEGAPSPKS